MPNQIAALSNGGGFLFMVSQDFRQIRTPRIASVTEICREVWRVQFLATHKLKVCIPSDASANLCKTVADSFIKTGVF
jgi:hypothetical protein